MPGKHSRKVQVVSTASSSKPIEIPSKGKVVIILPPRGGAGPPPMASSPSHRTAPNPQSVLLSSSAPSKYHHHHHHGSPPKHSPISQTRSSPRSYPPTLSANMPQVAGSGSKPGSIGRSVSHDMYTRSTITPITPMAQPRPSPNMMAMEEEYYNHPAVRAYEMQKAAEQARWTRNRMMQQKRAANYSTGSDSQLRPLYGGQHGPLVAPQQRW